MKKVTMKKITMKKMAMKKMAMQKRIACILIMVLALAALLVAGRRGTVHADMGLVQTDVGAITVPGHVQVVGLGEASHGVKEYQEMKAEVFKALVRNNGCRTFVIETDFGHALKVDDYIHGGEGTAKEAASLIGFRIYYTKEMEELIEWMRAYNETAPEGEDLHFYGMDMQWADYSKEYLFRILGQVSPKVSAEYEEALAFLNDTDMFDISAEAFLAGMPEAEKLIQEVDAARDGIEEAFGSEAFALARECAVSLYNCCDIRKSDRDYNAVRDGHMAEKVQWFIGHGDGSVIFINGHNGHIGKSNAIPYYVCLGQLLAEELGDAYFAIGTDARVTVFNNQMDDGFAEQTVENKNDLNALAGKITGNRYYVACSAVAEDGGWQKILSEKQRITTLNVTAVTIVKMFYTTYIIPKDTFDGMIVFDQVSPTTILE